MRSFMRERGIIALRVPERLERRHLHMIGLHRVIGLVAAMPNVRAGRREESFGPLDALH